MRTNIVLTARRSTRLTALATLATVLMGMLLTSCGTKYEAPTTLIAGDADALQSSTFHEMAESVLRPIVEQAYAHKATALPLFEFTSHSNMRRILVPGMPCTKAGSACRDKAKEFAKAVDLWTLLTTGNSTNTVADPIGAINDMVGALEHKQPLIAITPMNQKADGYDLSKVDLSTAENISRAVDELGARSLLLKAPAQGVVVKIYGIGTVGAAAISSTRAEQERAWVAEICKRSGVSCAIKTGPVA